MMRSTAFVAFLLFPILPWPSNAQAASAGPQNASEGTTQIATLPSPTPAPQSDAKVPAKGQKKAKNEKNGQPSAGTNPPKLQIHTLSGTTFDWDKVLLPMADKVQVNPSKLNQEKKETGPKTPTPILLINGHEISGNAIPNSWLQSGQMFTLTVLQPSQPGECRANEQAPMSNSRGQSSPLLPNLTSNVDNSISIPEMKFVDTRWLQSKLKQAAQAIGSIAPWNATPITSQYGAYQGVTNSSSNFALQLNPATATVPSAPQATGTPTAPTSTSLSSLGILAQEVQLNAELLKYQSLYNGAASDNLRLQPDGTVLGSRRQVTRELPVTVQGTPPYRDAVAEVRVVMVPTKSPGSGLSVVNLIPEALTYNVAKVTSNTSQFGAGVNVSLIGVGATGGKSKSSLYLAKDTDTVALQYATPSARPDSDLKRPFLDSFRNTVSTGPCEATTNDSWGKAQ
jgi:hypothetical protein